MLHRSSAALQPLLVLAGALLALAPAARGQAPVADYGDAPDGVAAGYPAPFDGVLGQFPTLFGTANGRNGAPGAFALDGGADSLGAPPSVETDANDPADPDGAPNLVDADSDDGSPGIVVIADSIPARARLAIDVSIDPQVPVRRFLNVLIDLDLDGRWSGRAAGGEPEWAVRNLEVDTNRMPTARITTPDFLLSNGPILPDGAWMRIALTRAPVDTASVGPEGWDGSGGFSFGEIEDYQILFGRDGGGKFTPVTDMCCPQSVNFNGQAAVNFTCIVFSRTRLLLAGAPPSQADVFFNPLPGNVVVPLIPVAGLAGAPVPPPVGFVGRSLAPFPPGPGCPPPPVGGPFGQLITLTATRPPVPSPFRSRYAYLARPVDPPGPEVSGKVIPDVLPVFREIDFVDLGVGKPDVYPPYDDPYYQEPGKDGGVVPQKPLAPPEKGKMPPAPAPPPGG